MEEVSRIEDDVGKEYRVFLACALSLLASAAVLILVWAALRYCFGYLDHPDLSEVVQASIIDGSAFKPETVEKLQYVASLALFPPLAFLSLPLFLRLFARVEGRRLSLAYGAAMVLAAALLCGLTAAGLVAEKAFLVRNVAYDYPLMAALVFFLVIAAMALYTYKVDPLPSGHLLKKALNTGLLLASLYVILMIPARFILEFGRFSAYQISPHFNAYFYSVSQVFSGKALLVDLNNQYGLYPHFLEPIFRVIGLSTFSFYAVMALLLAVAFLCFYLVLYKCVGHPVIRFLGLAALLYFGYVFFNIIADPYFQFFPHRIIFPGLLLALSYFYFARGGRLPYYLTHIVCAVSILWNVETGIVVFLTWILALLYRDLLRDRGPAALKSMVKDASVGILALAGTIAAYSLYVYVRYGGLPDLPALISYQYYFYGVGFFMLPMPPVNPWNLVALVYMAGIVYALWALLARDDSVRTKMIFTLSILGAGIFSYYQGRSHPNVLVTVWYPALILVVIFADMLYGRVVEGMRQRRIVPGEVLLLSLMVFFIATSAAGLALNHGLVQPSGAHDGPYISGMIEQNSGFIAGHLDPGENALILSYCAGLYHAGTQTASPLGVPGICEILKKDEMGRVVDFLKSDDLAGRKVFVDPFFPCEYGDNIYVIQPLLDDYELKDISGDGTLFFYEKRPDGTDGMKPSIGVPGGAEVPDVLLHCTYDEAAHAFFTPDGRFAAYENSCGLAVLPNDSYSIEILVYPGKEQVSYAVILDDYLNWYGHQGFIIQQDAADQNVYTYTYGAGPELIPALRFKLSADSLNYVAITDDGKTLKAYVNGTPVSSYAKTLPFCKSVFPLRIGNSMSYYRHFNGTIREIKITGHGLGEAEIASKCKAMGPGTLL